MAWWVPEVTRVVVLAGGAVLVQQLIRRYGVGYAEYVFRSTPGAGTAFLALADIAYYLIVVAYIAFSVKVHRFNGSEAAHLQNVVATIGGLALIIGLLHAFNVFALPRVGAALAGRRNGTKSRRHRPGPEPQV